MTVKDRERTFASNLIANYHVWSSPSGIHDDPAAEEGERGLSHAHRGALEEFGAAYRISGGSLDEGGIYEGTTSAHLTPPLGGALFDEIVQVAIFVLGHYVPSGSWPLGNELGSVSRTGDVGATLGRIVAPGSAYSAGDLFTYFSTPAETVEPRAAEQPHQMAVGWIKTATGLSWERVGRLAGVSRQAVDAWRKGGPIADEHHRQLLKARDVLERAAKRNPQPGGLAAWLDTPRGADARTPADLLEAGEVGKARLLALSGPSPGVKAPPEWARRNARKTYLNSRERVRALPPERGEQLLDALEDEDDG